MRTTMLVQAAVPPMSLPDAAQAVCAQAPNRVLTKYKTVLTGNLTQNTLNTLHRHYGDFDCAFHFPNPTAEAGAFYLLSTATGPSPCTFQATARVLWFNTGPPAHAVPPDETYTETCSSLR